MSTVRSIRTRSGRSYGRPSGSTTQPEPEEPVRPQQRAEGGDDDDDVDEDYYMLRDVKHYTRKCKLNSVLQDNINREVLQNHLLLISRNYSCIHFDAMNFMHYLAIYQETENRFLFNPTDISHIQLCYRLVLPEYQIRANDTVMVNEPITYHFIQEAKDNFQQMKDNQNYQEVNIRDNENEVDLIYQYLARSFAIQYQTNVKNHLVNVALRLLKTLEAFIFSLKQANPTYNPPGTPKQIAGTCVNFIMDAAQPFSENLETYIRLSDEIIAPTVSWFHIAYITSFENNVNRDKAYVEDVDNIGVTAIPLLKFHGVVLGFIENTRLINQDEHGESSVRVKRWSLLPLPTNRMIHFRLSGAGKMYHFLLQFYKKLPMVRRQTIPFAVAAMMNIDRLPRFAIFEANYRRSRNAIWDSLFDIRGKFGRDSRGHFLNSITTDGYDVSFLFEKPSPTSNIIPITFRELNFRIPLLVDISEWTFGLLHLNRQPVNIPERRVIGVDPGIRDLITCTSEAEGVFRLGDGRQIRKATTYSVSNREYQYRRGLYRAYQLELGRRAFENMQEVYDQIAGTAKTAYIDELLDHLGSVYSVRQQQVSHRMVEFNNGLNHRETLFYLYSQRQVALTEMGREIRALGAVFTADNPGEHNHNMVCKSFGYPVARVSVEIRNQLWNEKKAILLPDGADTEMPILSYGDKSLRPTMRGHAALPVKHIREFFSESMITIMVDEYRTSIMCSSCGARMAAPAPLVNFEEDETEGERFRRLRTTYPLKQCVNCRTVWNRDYNASRNMAQILNRYIQSGYDINSRPAHLTRPRRAQGN